MPAAMSHAGTMPAPAYNAGFKKITPQFMLAHLPAVRHTCQHTKRVGLEFDHAIAPPVVMPAHLPTSKKRWRSSP